MQSFLYSLYVQYLQTELKELRLTSYLNALEYLRSTSRGTDLYLNRDSGRACIWGWILTRGRGTNSERVPGVSLGTEAVDVMQGDLAERVRSAESVAGVCAPLPNAGLITGALAVHEALGPTVWWRSYELRQTAAGSFVIWQHLALGIRSAGRGVARILAGLVVDGCSRRNRRVNRAQSERWIGLLQGYLLMGKQLTNGSPEY